MKTTNLVNQETKEAIRLIKGHADVMANALEDSSTSNLASLIEYASVKEGRGLDHVDQNVVNFSALRKALKEGQEMELAA